MLQRVKEGLQQENPELGKGATSGFFVEKVGDARTMMIPWIEITIAIAIITVIHPAQH